MDSAEHIYLKRLDENIRVVDHLNSHSTTSRNVHNITQSLADNDRESLYKAFHSTGFSYEDYPDPEQWKSIRFFWKSILASASLQSEVRHLTLMSMAQIFSLFHTIDEMKAEQAEEGARFLTDKIIDLYASSVKEFDTITNQHVAKAIQFINTKLKSRDLQLSTIAEELDISSPYLSSIFQKEMQETITSYIHRKKIKASTEHLIFTNYSIKNVALEYGYSSVTSYGRKFREVMGTTPLKYRKAHSF
ncbi:helix-turn-helix domain-containing protein [Salimicrobium humidisoli]|uniref:HTH araC/xylS-type domain-containing protein n=1 Tax=Salimicrobium humidisoli TaxID=2029857 RepID=A0ABX4HTB2_9BACI|nr:AraC family transcriptional regulator [Salimicrobium humidisoli]PBB06477.1 hypothetical protein CKW00_03885 [Salimicrobium humidisoli]